MTKKTKQWQAAAEMLRRQGYAQTTTGDPLLPVVFTRGVERVYLYAPLLRRNKGPDRAWVARDVSYMPQVFGTRDIAEHFGISMDHVQFEYYRSRRLRPSQRVGTNGSLLSTREDIIAWLKRRRPLGRPRTEKYRSRETLGKMTGRRLWKLFDELVEAGEVKPLSDDETEDWIKTDLVNYLAKDTP